MSSLIHEVGFCLANVDFRMSIWFATLRKMSPYSQSFWFTFSRIRTRITPNTETFHAVQVILQMFYPIINTHGIKKPFALYFHDDTP